MGSSGDQAAGHEAETRGRGLPSVEGPGRLSIFPNRHLFSLDSVPPDGSIDEALRINGAVTECKVSLLDLPPTESHRKREVDRVLLGNDHRAGCVLIEPVDDPGTLDAADTGEVLTVVEQCVDQGSGGVSCRGMNDQPGRLVEDEQVGILVEDLKWYLLRDEFGWAGFRNLDLEDVSSRNPLGRTNRFPVPPDQSFIDPFPDTRAGPLVLEIAQASVEALARFF